MKTQAVIEQGVVAGNSYDKYGTRNPLARRLMNGFLATVTAFVKATGAADAHEVGCGEGLLSLHLYHKIAGLSLRGSDFSEQVIDVARRNAVDEHADIPFSVKSIYDLTVEQDAAPLVICCEVLEHLEDPHAAMDVLASLARPWLIVSVPREPIWRVLNMARLKYVPQLGNTPGHLNHWSTTSFVSMLQQHIDIVEVAQPLPWTVCVCRSR